MLLPLQKNKLLPFPEVLASYVCKFLLRDIVCRRGLHNNFKIKHSNHIRKVLLNFVSKSESWRIPKA